MSIKLKLEGFDELLKQIETAGGSIDGAVDSCMRQSAIIVQDSLKNEMKYSGVDEGLIQRMPQPSIEKSGNTITARVGYKKGDYDSENLSDGYKVVFLNYGTPNRKKHGKINPNDEAKRGFIQRAKKKCSKKLKKEQKIALEKILSRLEK